LKFDEIIGFLGEKDFSYNPMIPPIYETSIFKFEKFEDMMKALLDEEVGYLYSRGNNPTVRILEKKLAALEKTEDARVFSSGMAAISSAILSFISSGDHVVCVDDCYSWTRVLLEDYLRRFNVKTTFVPPKAEDILNAVRKNTRIIYLESPTTMTFKVLDLEKIAIFAKEKGIITIIDNSWATPIFQNPSDFGIDIIVHSISKYINGHSDVVGGVVAGRKELIKHIFENEFLIFGGNIGPFEAWLVLRGLRTLKIRMERHFSNTMTVLKFLKSHPKVKEVNYPLDVDNENYELAKKQLRGGSGLLSFRLNVEKPEQIVTFVNSLKIFRLAVSWGGFESLVFPTLASKKLREQFGWNLIRLSIGLENPDILIDDLAQALKKV